MEQSSPSPEIIIDTLIAYQKSAALKGAIDLDLFTAIGEGACTAGDIAARCDATERGVRSLCDYLVVSGFLTKNSGGYGLTAVAANFLDRNSSAYVGSVSGFLNAPQFVSAFDDIAAVVRNGGTLMGGAGTMRPEHPVWIEFAKSMEPLARSHADQIATLLEARAILQGKVLDIAAGHGLYGIELAKRNPDIRVVAVDWDNVLSVARDNARKAGVDDRFDTMVGSAFELDLGGPYELVLLTNFLHHFDTDTCETFLRKVHGALSPTGHAVTLEPVPNEDRVSPPYPACFTLIMLATTEHGDAYTASEFDAMFRNAGFAKSEFESLGPSKPTVVISHR